MYSVVNNYLSKFVTTGKRLKEERERLGFNQADFAAIGGVGRKSQFNYEDDERKADTSYLLGIAEAGADVRYIITGQREGPAPVTLSADERELLALFRAAPLAVKAAAIGALQGGSKKVPNYTKEVSFSVGANNGQIIKGDVVNHAPFGFGNVTNKK